MLPIPLKDNVRRDTRAVITPLFIVLNALLFLFELSLGDRLEPFIFEFSIIPVRYTRPEGLLRHGLDGLVVPLLVSMFLHAGWGHLLGNMLFLWVFGRSIEDRLGHGRFLVFYLACGVGAGLTHILLNPVSPVPTVGASGAIAGVLGAYFLRYPGARITTLIPLFFLFVSLELPAFLILGYWFLIQFASGWQGLMIASNAGGGVAWWAHVGGFVVGFLLSAALRKRPRRRARMK